MDLAAVETKLIAEIASRFSKSPQDLRPEADLFDALGIDSYKAMELITELEDAFGVEVPDYELQGVTTFRGLAEVVGRRL